MDRNQIIGFSLLIALLLGYFAYNNYTETKFQEAKRADSIANAKAHPLPKIDSSKLAPVAVADTLSDSLKNALPPAYKGTAQTEVLENSKIALQFTTQGAYPVSALLKDYKTYDKKPLYLFNGKENRLSMTLPVNNGAGATSDLFYTTAKETKPNGDQTITFTSDLGDGKSVVITYLLPVDDYMLQTSIRTNGILLNNAKLTWQTQSLHTERDLANERLNSQIYYKYADGEHDYYTIKEGNEQKQLEKKVQWVGFRMHFFSTALIVDKGSLQTADIRTTDKLNAQSVSQNKTTFAVTPENGQSLDLKWYIGPNHYNTLRSYKMDLDEMVPLGYGVMSFVKYINKWLIIPIFDTLSKFISNFGVIIMLMTIIIRLLLSFFTYKSYLSAAKMRVLKPEIDALREKHGDDQQKFGMDQMKLYRTAGVNPLGGCLPTLLQLPILFAMYYFFPSSIELRQEKFLWADDLSTYDSIVSWTTHIPIISSVFGNHLSLFTILMTASSLFLALYNRNMTPQDPNNPMMKWMPYVFPFMLIGVFNKMAAALTFYYFFSNMISIAQQFLIQKLFINEEKIHAQIQENKNKPATPSKWAARMEEMQKTQMERMKNTSPKTKK
jgi:YidC/Oxa1 family membrane protein insertase